MAGGVAVVARWQNRSGSKWVEVTRCGDGRFQWRTSERKARIGYLTVAECAARAAIEAGLMPGPALKLVSTTVSVESRTGLVTAVGQ